MLDVVRFAILGASAGSIIALLGLGINVIYRSSRVINFSHAAIAITAAYAYSDFQRSRFEPVALVLAIVVGMAVGALTDTFVMRMLRGSSALTRAIATIGVLITLQAILNIHYGYYPIVVKSLLPTSPVHFGSVAVGSDRLIIFGICALLTAILYVVYRRSSFGIATTAAAVNERSLAALGSWSPRRVAFVNWVVAGGLAGLAGVLLAPITSLAPTLSVTLIVPVLSAALVGRLSSFWLTFAGGIAIGIAQAELGHFTSTPGVQEAVPFLLIVLVLALRGSSLPQRGQLKEKLPRVASGRVPFGPIGFGFALTLVLLMWVLSENWVQAVTVGLMAALILLSLVVVTGYAGQLSLASYGLAGVAALVAAQLVANAGWSFLPAALVGVAATIPVGFVVGLPAVRTRGTSLAIVTLGLSVALQALIFDNTTIAGGTTGLPIGDPTLFGFNISAVYTPRRYAVFVLVVFTLVGLAVLRLRRSSIGRRMVAVRGNESAAASLGISVVRAKLQAFMISSVIAGVGGVVLAFTNIVLVLGNPGGRFDSSQSINAIAQITIGGVGSVGGAIIGTIAEPGAVVNQLLRFISGGGWFDLIGGVLLLLALATAPNGVAANIQRDFAHLRARFDRRRQRQRAGGFVLRPTAVGVERIDDATLQVLGLGISFGGNAVLHDIDLDVVSGRVLGVIGPNGAGKTTVVDAITGYNRPDAGSVRLDGVELLGMTPTRRARAGVSRSFQALELFEDLSVGDNLLVASEQAHSFGIGSSLLRRRRGALSDAALAAVRTFGLENRLDDATGDLSYGERRLLGIARALATWPRILLLDEPAAGLGADERRELSRLVRTIASEWGIGVLLIEHDVELVLNVSDEVVALDFGRVIARGTPEQVRRDPAVVAAYLGTDEAADDAGATGVAREVPR